jgi:short-subunit dehydrogenase
MNSIVVVTGATAGVGRATAREFARKGCRLGLIARGQDQLDATAAELRDMGAEVCAVAADMADADAVERAAERIETDLGPIDIWVNNAMTSVFSPVKEMKPEEYRRVTEVTYLGQVYGTLAALKRMLPRDRGAIILVGSALAYRGIPLQSSYCAAKHAIQGFFDSLRPELIHDGSHVRATMIQMPAMNTPQFQWVKSRLPNKPQPVPPIFQPEVAAEVIVWAAHHDRREIFVGMPTVEAIVANKLEPGMLDRYLAKTGFKSQQTEEPADPNRPDNLWEPAPGDFGAHGPFDDRARNWSPQVWATLHRSWILAGVGVAGALGTALYQKGRR